MRFWSNLTLPPLTSPDPRLRHVCSETHPPAHHFQKKSSRDPPCFVVVITLPLNLSLIYKKRVHCVSDDQM